MEIANYSFLSNLSPDSVRFVRSDSTNRIRKDVTVARKLSEFQAQTQTYSVPSYGFNFRSDVADPSGNPVGQRLSAAVDFRMPVTAVSSEIDQLLVDLRAWINDPALKETLLSQVFPTAAVTAP